MKKIIVILFIFVSFSFAVTWSTDNSAYIQIARDRGFIQSSTRTYGVSDLIGVQLNNSYQNVYVLKDNTTSICIENYKEAQL